MSKDKQNHIYVYDRDHHKVIVIDGETGEQISDKDDRVTSILKHLKEKEETVKLRKFAVWCAYQTNQEFKPIQKKLIELAESALNGEAGTDELREMYEETEGAAVATDTVGLRQGSHQAPAFLSTRECINPDAYDAAIQSARFHRLWSELKQQDPEAQQVLKEVKVDSAGKAGKDTEQKQVDYLLDLINE